MATLAKLDTQTDVQTTLRLISCLQSQQGAKHVPDLKRGLSTAQQAVLQARTVWPLMVRAQRPTGSMPL